MAVFSIYLQLDESTDAIKEIAIEEITTHEQTCLERWDYLKVVNEKTEDHKLIEDSRELNIEFFITLGCADSFREWMPVSHSSWDTFADFEINKKSRCETYLKGGLELDEWAKPVWQEMGCEEITKQ